MRVLAAASFVSALSLLCSSGSFAQQVWVVDRDGGAGVDFTMMSTAIETVASGDILLVREAALNYGNVTISGKSLTVIADPETAGVRPSLALVRVTDLTAGQVVTFQGFSIAPPAMVFQPGVWVQDCAGAVLFEDVVIAPQMTLGPAPVVSIESSSRVILSRASILGAAMDTTFPVHGLSVVGSTVAVYDSSIAGTDGRDAQPEPLFGQLVNPAVQGGDGVVVGEASTVLIAGCEVSGGEGGDGFLGLEGCTPSADGGAGVTVIGALVRMDSSFQGGAAGVDVAGCPQVGVAGLDVDVSGGSVKTVADTLRRFQVSVPIHEGTSALNTIEGVPGDPVVLLVAFSPDGTIFPNLGGALVGAPPFITAFIGAVPPSGTLSFSVPVAVGSLPPSIDGISLYEQIAVPGASGFGLLGAPAVVTIVR